MRNQKFVSMSVGQSIWFINAVDLAKNSSRDMFFVFSMYSRDGLSRT